MNVGEKSSKNSAENTSLPSSNQLSTLCNFFHTLSNKRNTTKTKERKWFSQSKIERRYHIVWYHFLEWWNIFVLFSCLYISQKILLPFKQSLLNMMIYMKRFYFSSKGTLLLVQICWMSSMSFYFFSCLSLFL